AASTSHLQCSQSADFTNCRTHPGVPGAGGVVVRRVQFVVFVVPNVVFGAETHYGSPDLGFFCSGGLTGDDLAEDFVEGDGDTPVGIVGLELGEVGDVADVIADAVLIYIFPIKFFAGHLLDFGDGFKNGNTVFAAPAEVVDLAGAGIGSELLDGPDDIVTVDVVAHLFTLIAEDRIRATGNGHFHQVREESV